MSFTIGDVDVLYSWERRYLVWLEMEMSCMASDGDISYRRRRLSTLVRADEIHPY